MLFLVRPRDYYMIFMATWLLCFHPGTMIAHMSEKCYVNHAKIIFSSAKAFKLYVMCFFNVRSKIPIFVTYK